METIMIYAYEFVCSALPAFVAFLVIRQYVLRNDERAEVPSIALGIALSVYLFGLFHFTGAGTLHDAMRFGVEFNPSQMNFIPLIGFMEDAVTPALNVLLFVPLGVFAFLFSGNRLAALPIAAMALATSFAIEISQLLNSRIVDVNDLLMNATGAVVGYAASKAMLGRRPSERASLHIAISMAVVAFIVRFLAYDEMRAAKVLFGF